MTLAQAQADAGAFRECLLDNGVRAVSIELQQGVAGSGWYVGTFKRGMGHHIASRPSQGLTPGLATVKNGRGGANPLTGPLANCYGGYDRVARIITLGWANHPGTGGPWSVPGWGTVPRDNGRPYIVGWEFEGGYEPYTDEMHDFMARCGAGTLDFLGTLPGNPGPAPVACWDEHKGWAGPRKPDRIGYTTASGQARIAAVRGTTPPRTPTSLGDDMAVIITASGKGPFGPRVPALYAGPGAFIGLAGANEQANARAKLPEIWVEPGTWDALAADRAAFLAGAKAQAEARDLLKGFLAAQQPPTAP